MAAAAGAIEVLLLSSAAYAADSPYLSLDPLRGPSGTTVTAQGTGFCVSCGPVEIDFGARPVKQGIAVASDGSFQTTFIVPGGAQAGTDAVNAYQQGKLVTQTSFTVTPSAPAPTTTPQQTSSPAPGPSAGDGSSPGAGPSAAPQPTTTPTANAAGPSPAASNAGTGPSSAATSAAPTAIVLSALALLVIGMAVALFYRWLKAKPLS